MNVKIEINGVKCLKKGVKSPSGKYSPVYYSRGAHYAPGKASGAVMDAITIYARSFGALPKELGRVVNQSDSQTDYFEQDRVTFYAGSPEFNALLPLCAA